MPAVQHAVGCESRSSMDETGAETTELICPGWGRSPQDHQVAFVRSD